MQLDANPFAWLDTCGPPPALHAAIDDAPGTGLAVTFRPAALSGAEPCGMKPREHSRAARVES